MADPKPPVITTTRSPPPIYTLRGPPPWVKIAVSLALGLGTVIGWKRIVVTVGEKIGKAHLTYAQGAAAELVAFGTIEAADLLGLPVSTTHILSSGIAGTMVALILCKGQWLSRSR
jgi:phosphate/sulfate permease